jgi:hypothetical protein
MRRGIATKKRNAYARGMLDDGCFFNSPPDESGSSGAYGVQPDVPLASSSFCRKNEVFQRTSCSAGVSPPQAPNSFGA